jgi:hypothetical protein
MPSQDIIVMPGNTAPCKTVPADEPHFQRVTGFECRHERDHGAGREVGDSEWFVRAKQNLLAMEVHLLEVRKEASVHCWRQQRKEPVFGRLLQMDRPLGPIGTAISTRGHRLLVSRAGLV